MTSAGPIVVAIPARNEARHLPACLHALAQQPDAARDLAAVVLFANNCSDDTAAIARAAAMPCAVVVVEVTLPPEQSHIGYARRGATENAAAWLRAHGQPHGIIASTDADTIVSPDWLSQLQAAFCADIDAVCGEIDLPLPMPPALANARRIEADYAACAAQVSALLDPLPHDPWPNHIWSWGANIAVRADVLARIGGTPLVNLAEDRALHALLLAHDARVRHASAVRVTTSARADGRAPGGFADLLADYVRDPGVLADFALEPAARTWRRARLRGVARRRWGDAPGFGAHWAALEQSDDTLARLRVPLVQLERETTRLRRRINILEHRSDTSRCARGRAAAL